MKKHLPLLAGIAFSLAALESTAQLSFTSATNRFADQTVYSGCGVAVIDWNNDGLDDVVRLDGGYMLKIEEQKSGNSFISHDFGQLGSGNGWAWGMAVGDVDGNGYKDVIAGGYSSSFPLRIFMFDNTGTAGTIVNLPNGGFFVQNITLGDINEDGHIDIFVCDDNAESHIYLNDGSGNFPTQSSIINFDVSPTDDSGNYGSVWTDYDNDGDLDLYIAKCRQAVTGPGATSDGRRINVLFRNNGDGTFTESAATHNIAIGWQSWTASFGDIDNDNDFDLLLTNHDYQSQILENDGTGTYSDITATTNFNINNITPIESAFEDFDNDGFIDILITGTDHRLWRNNGDKTFSLVSGLFNANSMESFGIGDLNHDGFVDVYGSYANIYTNPSNVPDELWLNDGNANHFITLSLEGTVSNIGAVGARATIYGPWGLQTREVRNGESYGNVYSSQLHFGLGSNTDIDSVVIDWPMGGHQVIPNVEPDQFITIIENDCVSPLATISSSSGSFAICSGNAITLSAPSGIGYSYLWSDGSTAQTLVVSTAGEYSVVVNESGNNCPGVSPSAVVVVDPNDTPSVSINGDTEFCNGESVVLTGPSALSSYSWSNGGTTQSITVTNSGSYTLTVQGACGPASSTPVNVVVHTAADPVTTDDNIPSPGTGNLTATGTNVSWYDASTGGNLVGTGNNFTTPVVSTSTTFYAENSEFFGGGTPANGGMPNHTGTNYFSGNTTNATMTFDVNQLCILKTVKVYTDAPGNRMVQVFDSNNNLVASQMISVTGDSAVVDLNFTLQPGTGYYITTDASVNNANFGYNSPRFRRNSVGVNYPYSVGSNIDITTSSAGGQYYYYFYDWHVEPLSCTSNRVPATVFVNSGVGIDELTTDQFSVYPNPASEVMFVDSKVDFFTYEVVDVAGRSMILANGKNGVNTIDLNGFSAGVYLLKIHNGEQTVTQKIIVK